MQAKDLVLGIDGGGTKTVAWLAPCCPGREPSIVGRGVAGPSNPQTVGFAAALEHLNRAVGAAFDHARIPPAPVAAAVLGLAGSDRDENRRVLRQWAKDQRVAHRFRVVHDALPVLSAGSPDGWGIALICGTGSLAFGRSRDGRSARAGGWGFLLGDEGSGYAIARAGLRAAAQSADGRGPHTRLLDALLKRLELERPEALIPTIYPMAADPAAIASLAEVVVQTAGQHDATAQSIVDEAAADLAAMVAAVTAKLDLAGGRFPLVLSGGVLLPSPNLQDGLQTHLTGLGLHPDPIASVADPALGAVKLALLEATGHG